MYSSPTSSVGAPLVSRTWSVAPSIAAPIGSELGSAGPRRWTVTPTTVSVGPYSFTMIVSGPQATAQDATQRRRPPAPRGTTPLLACGGFGEGGVCALQHDCELLAAQLEPARTEPLEHRTYWKRSELVGLGESARAPRLVVCQVQGRLRSRHDCRLGGYFDTAAPAEQERRVAVDSVRDGIRERGDVLAGAVLIAGAAAAELVRERYERLVPIDRHQMLEVRRLRATLDGVFESAVASRVARDRGPDGRRHRSRCDRCRVTGPVRAPRPLLDLDGRDGSLPYE